MQMPPQHQHQQLRISEITQRDITTISPAKFRHRRSGRGVDWCVRQDQAVAVGHGWGRRGREQSQGRRDGAVTCLSSTPRLSLTELLPSRFSLANYPLKTASLSSFIFHLFLLCLHCTSFLLLLLFTPFPSSLVVSLSHHQQQG